MIKHTLHALAISALLYPSVGTAKGLRSVQAHPHQIVQRQYTACVRRRWCTYIVVPAEDEYTGATEHDVPREHEVPTERDAR